MSLRVVKVTIVYRGGATVKLRCKSFTVKSSSIDGTITALEWDTARPRPLFIGNEDIIAVWSRRKWRWMP